MDETRFDQLTRNLAGVTGRRGAFSAMGATGIALLSAFGLTDTDAARKRGKRNGHHRSHRNDKKRHGNDAGAEKKKKKKKCKNGLQKCKLSKRKRICVDFQTDNANCGGCGIRCEGAQSCSGGACQTAPAPPAPPPPTGECAVSGTCSDRPKCGPEGTTCSCGTTVEGEGFCTSGGGCGDLPPCEATSNCADSAACSLGCCSSPVCIPACAPVCTPEPPATTCTGKECGPATNNCGDELFCGLCAAGEFCNDGTCEPEPPLVCPACGTCQRLTVADDGVGACNQACLAGTLCADAPVDSRFRRLYSALLLRGFLVSGEAFATEVEEVDGLPGASILHFPFVNGDTGDTAGLSYGIASTGGQPIPIAVIGDADQVPYLALVVDNGNVVEIEPEAGSGAARGPRRRRKQGRDVVAASAPGLTCRRCSAYCRWGTNLSGMGIGTCLVVVAFAATGIGAIALALAGAAIAVGGFVAGEFCPNWCGCLYCFCTDACYNDTTSCQAVCRPGLGCFTGICEPAQPGDC